MGASDSRSISEDGRVTLGGEAATRRTLVDEEQPTPVIEWKRSGSTTRFPVVILGMQ